MPAVLFLICLAIGAIAGARGGVIIKPVLDLFYLLPLSTVSFCSGYTVLDMSICSLIRTRSNGVKLELRTSTPLRGRSTGRACGEMSLRTGPQRIWP